MTALFRLCNLFVALSAMGLVTDPARGQEGTSAEWFLGIDGERSGPFSEKEVIAKISAGELPSDALVWKEGMANWEAAGENGVLSGHFSSPTPSLPGLPDLPKPPPLKMEPDLAPNETAPAAQVSSGSATLSSEREWYVGIAGEKTGPYRPVEIQRMLADGEIDPTSLVWKEGMAGWTAVAKVPVLAVAAKPASSTPVAMVPTPPSAPEEPAEKPEPNPKPDPKPEPKVDTIQPRSISEIMAEAKKKDAESKSKPSTATASTTRPKVTRERGKVTVGGIGSRNPIIGRGADEGSVSSAMPSSPKARPTSSSVGSSPPSAPAAPASSAVITTTGSKMSVADAKALTDYHNQVRREVGVGALTWSPEIARFAQEWADHIARTGQFAHRPRAQQRYGENLAQGGAGSYTVVKLAQLWYGEKKLYPRGSRFSVSLLPAGHYTQMVWRGTTQFGAGIAQMNTGNGTMTILVCNYNPQGNIVGELPY